MKATTAEIFNARYKAITDPLPKDRNGYVGKSVEEQFENLCVHFHMAWHGVSEEAARAALKRADLERREIETQESIAEVWP